MFSTIKDYKSGPFYYNGNINIPFKVVTLAAYTLDPNDNGISSQCASAATYSLPANPVGYPSFYVKDGLAAAATNNITIQTTDSTNIVGATAATSYVMATNGQCTHVGWDGAQWLII